VIRAYVGEFLDYARRQPNISFELTPIGCGLAGYRPEQIAPMFSDAPPNVILPDAFDTVSSPQDRLRADCFQPGVECRLDLSGQVAELGSSFLCANLGIVPELEPGRIPKARYPRHRDRVRAFAWATLHLSVEASGSSDLAI